MFSKSTIKLRKIKPFVLLALCSTLASVKAMSGDDNKNRTLLAETSLSHTSTQVVNGRPVVIHTQLQNYEQPSLKEYQECHENLEKCKTVCEGVENTVKCIEQCPVCPYLIKEKLVVQGINDTDLSSAAVAPLNTTNIIRLTNQIRNIIETHQGSITNRNENIVHVHQNTSRVGGKFGLGFNNTEPCCIIVRSAKNCDDKLFSTGTRCHQKRHRVCGKQCKARVMIAQRWMVCDKPISYQSKEDYEYSDENCRETVKYVPYNPSRKQHFNSRSKCTFAPSWPYISCGENLQDYENLICGRCLDLPYYYILQNGIPAQCTRCFMAFSRSSNSIPPRLWHSNAETGIEGTDFLLRKDFESQRHSWHQDKKMCRLPDGTISENCQMIGGSTADTNPWGNLPESGNDSWEYGGNEDDFEHNLRNRRQTFSRSKYSRRYRKQRSNY